jgi:hypothetical protein
MRNVYACSKDMMFEVKVKNSIGAMEYCQENFLIGTFGYSNKNSFKFLDENDAMMFKMGFIDKLRSVDFSQFLLIMDDE